MLNALLGALSVVRALMDIGSAQRVSGRAEHDIRSAQIVIGQGAMRAILGALRGLSEVLTALSG